MVDRLRERRSRRSTSERVIEPPARCRADQQILHILTQEFVIDGSRTACASRSA